MLKGNCYCDCGGVVVDGTQTVIVSTEARFVSCKRCYKVWDMDYVCSQQKERDNIVLSESEQTYYLRQMKGKTL